MATYRYICKEHQPAEITELRQSMKKEIPEKIPCSLCQKPAPRHWMGLNFYAIVPGGHGGGPATK